MCEGGIAPPTHGQLPRPPRQRRRRRCGCVVLPRPTGRGAESAGHDRVDASANRRPIDPNIYGVAHATTAELNDLNSPLNRNGGNNTTRYNWQLNADNRGNDWYFESIAESSATAGERGDTFVANARAGQRGGDADDSDDRLGRQGRRRTAASSPASPVAKYGAQTGNDWQWFPDAGNGVRTNGQSVTGNDPNDANVALDVAFQQGWVQHLVGRWGTERERRRALLHPRQRAEHLALHASRRPPDGADDGGDPRQDRSTIAQKIKAVDPAALVVGPEEWGWSGYFYSGYDQQYGSAARLGLLPDRANNHGGADYLPWLLDQLRQRRHRHGQRLLDVFTVHYYPQGGEFGDDVSSAMQLRRNRSTRSLWDPNYVDETWINDRVQLDPAAEGLGQHLLPGHADRHHRIQLGRREPHQRRHHAGRHLRHLRPRGARHGRALDDARRRARRPTRR